MKVYLKTSTSFKELDKLYQPTPANRRSSICPVRAATPEITASAPASLISFVYSSRGQGNQGVRNVSF